MANELTFGDALVDQLSVAEKALPKDFNRTRFVQNALSVLNGNPLLAKCNKSSLLEGLMKGAYLGLDFSNKEAYLIPYDNKAQFQTSYTGEIKFTKKYATQPIKDIYAKVVRQGDDFIEKIVDGKPSIDFKPVPFNDSDIVGAFAVCLFKDDTLVYETMSVKDIQSVRNNYSKAAQSKAWKSSFDEMCKKTVLRRLCKHIDTDFENVEMRNAWEDGSGFEFNTASAVDHSDIAQPSFAKKEEPTISEENIIDSTAEVIPDVPNFA